MRRLDIYLGAAAIAVVALAVAGLALGANGPSVAQGAKVFATAGCATCHTLALAKSKGTFGPNLDRLKPTAARVERQVRAGGGGMPPFAGRLTPAQMRHVAAFVAAASRGKTSVAVKPSLPADPRLLFRATCGGCHTLAHAGTKGTKGPNLDDESPSYDKVVERVTFGDDSGMPAFAKTLTRAQIAKLGAYVSSVAP
jgi:cytochrome c6